MIAITVRFRWLLAILVAFSLVLPHLTPSRATVSAGEYAQVVADSSASVNPTDLAAEAESLCAPSLASAGEPEGESFGDAYSGDYSHETDKLLMLFALHWGRAVASWSSIYSVALSPDPVFSFERPPKSAVA